MEHAPRVLVLYSNPIDSNRLRLDLEHKAMDRVLDELHLPPETIRRLHAVSAEDFPSIVATHHYEVLHFSGHGSREGIFLERKHIESGEIVDAKRLSAILSAGHRPRVIILMSCYSTDSLIHFSNVSPYVITVTGEGNDEACVEFSSAFYRQYLESSSVERAFTVASLTLEYKRLDSALRLCLTRSALQGGAAPYYVVSSRGDDSLIIDFSRIEVQIERLGIDRDRFLSLLGRKLLVHRFVFNFPREKTILSVGPYFAEFSWTSRDDPIICHSILELREDVQEYTCVVWATLLAKYNELYAARYRTSAEPASPFHSREIRSILEDYNTALGYLKLDGVSKHLRKIIPKQFKTSTSLVEANLHEAQGAYAKEDLRNVIAYLEGALTAIHDIVDALSVATVVSISLGKNSKH